MFKILTSDSNNFKSTKPTSNLVIPRDILEIDYSNRKYSVMYLLLRMNVTIYDDLNKEKKDVLDIPEGWRYLRIEIPSDVGYENTSWAYGNYFTFYFKKKKIFKITTSIDYGNMTLYYKFHMNDHKNSDFNKQEYEEFKKVYKKYYHSTIIETMSKKDQLKYKDCGYISIDMIDTHKLRKMQYDLYKRFQDGEITWKKNAK